MKQTRRMNTEADVLCNANRSLHHLLTEPASACIPLKKQRCICHDRPCCARAYRANSHQLCMAKLPWERLVIIVFQMRWIDHPQVVQAVNRRCIACQADQVYQQP